MTGARAAAGDGPPGRAARPALAGGVVVVTDSSASVAPEPGWDQRLSTVPLQVDLDGRVGREGVDVSPADVARALRDLHRVTTSRPAPAALVAAYDRAASAGATAVVSVHMSGLLSGTVDAARTAARGASVPVTVLDSRTIAMGLGFGVEAAVRAAVRGESPDLVAQTAVQTCAATRSAFCVMSWEHLRRGGRVSAAQAALGSVLTVRPILAVLEGALVPVERVRTTARAMARLVEIACDGLDEMPVQAAVHHADSPDRASDLAASLTARLPVGSRVRIVEVGAALAAHAGPGMLGIVTCRRPAP